MGNITAAMRLEMTQHCFRRPLSSMAMNEKLHFDAWYYSMCPRIGLSG